MGRAHPPSPRARTLTIAQFMTPAPHSIGRDQTLATAHEKMRGLRVRHLPVLEQGRLIGVVSQRDLYLVETLRDVDPNEVTVEDAMTQDVYTVTGQTALHTVVKKMMQRKLGCAVVMDGTHLAGIFTTTDALRALEAILSKRKPGAAPGLFISPG